MNKFFCIFPSEAGVSYGLAIDMVFDFAASFFNIAFNHNTFNDIMKVFILSSVVKNFGNYSGLLIELFAGI